MIASPPIVIEKSLGGGRFAGLAWSFLDTPDREGDIILPSALERAVASGAQPEIRVEHRKGEVAGVIDQMAISERGLEVEGQIDTHKTIGRKAYDQLRSRELGALSIGFLGSAEKSGRNRIFTDVAIHEISLVSEPMNSGARIHAVKSWGQVSSEMDLEKLLREVGMPNRLARKSAALVWPSLHSEDGDQAEAIVQRINQLTHSLRNPA
ncbi:MAG: hypothetical protein DI597_14430 [Pseudoxanthomonas spadix]|nr:MAG: hypothetical protein DI597_14430 [Pseudoxanthomonas spadix]